MSAFILDIVSVEGRKYLGRVEYVRIPAMEGDIGVYVRHAPLLTKLRASGIVEYRLPDAEKTDVFYVFGGFAEVQPMQVTLLADTVIRGHEVDAARMQEALTLERMLGFRSAGKTHDFQRAMTEINHFYLQNNLLKTHRPMKRPSQTFDH